MKQWMDNAMAFRKMSNDFMAKVRKEMQAPSRDDIDTIQLNVRHLETRILDRLEELSKQVEELSQQRGPGKTSPRAPKPRRRNRQTEGFAPAASRKKQQARQRTS